MRPAPPDRRFSPGIFVGSSKRLTIPDFQTIHQGGRPMMTRGSPHVLRRRSQRIQTTTWTVHPPARTTAMFACRSRATFPKLLACLNATFTCPAILRSQDQGSNPPLIPTSGYQARFDPIVRDHPCTLPHPVGTAHARCVTERTLTVSRGPRRRPNPRRRLNPRHRRSPRRGRYPQRGWRRPRPSPHSAQT